MAYCPARAGRHKMHAVERGGGAGGLCCAPGEAAVGAADDLARRAYGPAVFGCGEMQGTEFGAQAGGYGLPDAGALASVRLRTRQRRTGHGALPSRTQWRTGASNG